MLKRISYWLMAAAMCCSIAFTTKQDTAQNTKLNTLLTLRVTVYDQYGNRIENAHVHLSHPSSGRNWMLDTDKEGRVHIPVNNNTQYAAIAAKTGFMNSAKRVFQTAAKTSIDTVPVTLVLREPNN